MGICNVTETDMLKYTFKFENFKLYMRDTRLEKIGSFLR